MVQAAIDQCYARFVEEYEALERTLQTATAAAVAGTPLGDIPTQEAGTVGFAVACVAQRDAIAALYERNASLLGSLLFVLPMGAAEAHPVFLMELLKCAAIKVKQYNK